MAYWGAYPSREAAEREAVDGFLAPWLRDRNLVIRHEPNERSWHIHDAPVQSPFTRRTLARESGCPSGFPTREPESERMLAGDGTDAFDAPGMTIGDYFGR